MIADQVDYVVKCSLFCAHLINKKKLGVKF